MARPLKNTRKGKAATKKWRKTMMAKYGSPEAFHAAMQEKGAKGGRAGSTGGFYANPERARWAGQLGGKTSRVGRRYLGTKRGKRIYENLSTGEIERIAV